MNYSSPSLKTKISVVIPHMNGIELAEESLGLCLKSLDYRVDEIIIERNDGVGFAAAVNLGMKKATGDYIIVANNDTHLVSGNLFKLMKGMYIVTVPRIEPEARDNNPRSFYCISKEAYNYLLKEDGYFYDERFKMGYFEDDDLIRRLKSRAIKIVYEPSVVVHHLNGGGLTMKKVGEQKYFDINKKIYEEKYENFN